MRRLKKMVTAVVLAMSMILSTLPVMAADLDTPETEIETEEYEVNGLVYRSGVILQGSTYYDVTPPAGSNLNLWIDPTGGVTVTVIRPGAPAWPWLYQNSFSSETDTTIISNCDGGTYRVGFASNSAVFDFLLYEWH